MSLNAIVKNYLGDIGSHWEPLGDNCNEILKKNDQIIKTPSKE